MGMTPEIAAAVLDVSVDAEKATVERAYRALARATHPDRFVGADAATTARASVMFARATQAYGILSERAAFRASDAARSRTGSRTFAYSSGIASAGTIPMSRAVIIGWSAVLSLAVALSITGGAAPLGVVEVSLRMAVIAYLVIAFALTGRRLFFLGLVPLAILTAVFTFFAASFWSLFALMVFLAPVLALAGAGRRRAALSEALRSSTPADAA
jgi:ABC-type multidrug transport system fused ATPase/permease subunit